MERSYGSTIGIRHHDNEFARDRRHINGIESFWSYAKLRLRLSNTALPIFLIEGKMESVSIISA